MAALAVPGVPAAVFVAAFAGLRLVARAADQEAKRRWRDAVEAWTAARDALRDAQAERKDAAAELAAEKRRLKREQKAAETPRSSPATTGGTAHAAVLAEARRAVADAVRTLEYKEKEASRRQEALTTARGDLRDCATKSCQTWRENVLETSRENVSRAWTYDRKQLWKFLHEYIAVDRLPSWKDLQNGNYWTAASLVLPLVAVSVDLLYYRHFHLNALSFYSSASLPALASTVLMMAVLIVLSFAGFLGSVALLFVVVRILYWMLILAVAVLTRTLLVVLSPLPLLVSRSVLCAWLAAPGPESEAR